MILGFKEQFVTKILTGKKVHTIRADVHKRWQAGRKIHMASGVRTKDYVCFQQDTCKSVQEIQLNIANNSPSIIIDNRRLMWHECIELAKNDGFEDFQGLIDFFGIRHNITARLIHWTDFKY